MVYSGVACVRVRVVTGMVGIRAGEGEGGGCWGLLWCGLLIGLVRCRIMRIAVFLGGMCIGVSCIIFGLAIC